MATDFDTLSPLEVARGDPGVKRGGPLTGLCFFKVANEIIQCVKISEEIFLYPSNCSGIFDTCEKSDVSNYIVEI